MNVLVPIPDLLSVDSLESQFYGRVLRTHPLIRFHWPSRGGDLHKLRCGQLPPNAAPFAIDAPTLCDGMAEDLAGPDAALVVPLLASLVALQGAVFDAIDLPSTLPISHLVRSACLAFGVVVQRLVQNCLGSAAEIGEATWPEPISAEESRRLASVERASNRATEIRYCVGASPAADQGDADIQSLPLGTILAPLTEPADARAEGGTFTIAGDAALGLGAFIEALKKMSPQIYARARQPADMRGDLERALEAELRSLGLPSLPRGEAEIGLDLGPANALDAKVLEWGVSGRPLLYRDGGRTMRSLGEAFPEVDLQKASFKDISSLVAGLEGDRAARIPGSVRPADGALSRVYRASPKRSVAVTPILDRNVIFTPLLEASLPWRPAAALPDATFIVRAGGSGAAALAATLASLTRLEDVQFEACVLLDEETVEEDLIGRLVAKIGGFARTWHGARRRGMRDAVAEAQGALVVLLSPGEMVAPGFGSWLMKSFEDEWTRAALPRRAHTSSLQRETGDSATAAAVGCAFRRSSLLEIPASSLLGDAGAIVDAVEARFGPHAVLQPATNDWVVFTPQVGSD